LTVPVGTAAAAVVRTRLPIVSIEEALW